MSARGVRSADGIKSARCPSASGDKSASDVHLLMPQMVGGQLKGIKGMFSNVDIKIAPKCPGLDWVSRALQPVL
ncbi:hypothetical protein CEXT_52431 [Caerostris extrusa]|uniref:Uncharacterized protein n=1 Tax=Caerostris extrusa TaxID=172846 RepID=A0AAV4RRI8_CAEEX|nr:hypothetical protein CEXT_52431 [Caerostris extrusa]